MLLSHPKKLLTVNTCYGHMTKNRGGSKSTSKTYVGEQNK